MSAILDACIETAIQQGIEFLPASRPSGVEASLRAYLAQLLEANERVNLVSRRNTAEHIATFTRESAFLAYVLLEDAQRLGSGISFRLLDIGSGGGFPGIVLKLLLPDVEMVLVESTRKKAKFLADVCQTSDLSGITIVWARAEDLLNPRLDAYRPEFRHAFDWVTAKGLGKLRETARLAIPFLDVGGAHWTFKGPDHEDELRDCRRLFQQTRLQKLRVVRIPGDAESFLVGVRRLAAASTQGGPGIMS